MPIQRRLVSASDMQASIEREAKPNTIGTGVDDTVDPIRVRSLNSRVDDEGYNWAIFFIQDRQFSRHMIAAISKLRAMYNIE
jgi:hypothetical protein